jgi:protein translocase SecG subunit
MELSVRAARRHNQIMGIVVNIFAFIQVLVALGLLGIIMSQSTKSEGLSGTIGGKSESAFRGKPGTEERLQEVTKWLAVGFLAISAITAVLHSFAA